MKKVYSFKKEVIFKNNIYEILSIAIDKKFSLDGYALKGQFKINGDYLVRENEHDEFDIDIPYLNYIDDIYDISKIKVDIDDFYYEVKDSNRLILNIDIVVDGLEEKVLEERDEEVVTEGEVEEAEEISDDDRDILSDIMPEFIPDVEAKGELIDDDDPPEDAILEVHKEIEKPQEELKERPQTYMEEKNDSEFVTYRVCVVREGDTLESIMEKYNVSIDSLKKYNIINEIKNGDKLIIPYERN